MKKVLSVFLPQWSIELGSIELAQYQLRKKEQQIASSQQFEARANGGTNFRQLSQNANGLDFSKEVLVLTTVENNTEIIVSCSVAATQAGLEVGMNLSAAKSRVSELIALPYNRNRDIKALERLCKWAYRFSPLVAADLSPSANTPSNNGLNIDITGCEKLFKGEENIISQIRDYLKRFGISCRIAIAPTLGAAWALSRYHRDEVITADKDSLQRQLLPLPIAALRLTEDTIFSLQELNIKTIGELLQLSRSVLLERFNKELFDKIDQALGHKHEPLTPITIKQPLYFRKIFQGPCTDLETIQIVGSELLDALLSVLEKKREKISSLYLDLRRFEAPKITKEIVLSFPSLNRKHIAVLLSRQIEQLNLGYGIEAMTLLVKDTEPLTPAHLNEKSSSKKAFAELVDNLTEHLGAKNIMQVECTASHVPEKTFAYTAFVKSLAQKSSQPVSIRKYVDRPSVLFTKPQPIHTMSSLPDHPPFWLKWQQRAFKVTSAIGPERISPEWWVQRENTTRDYFRVQLHGGTWLWVFKELETQSWYVHGVWT